MGKIIAFGAGGRAGRRTVAGALARGHQVTAVVRDPGEHADLGSSGSPLVDVVAGDVTDPVDVERLVAGHDAAITTAARLDVPAVEFYTAATSALVQGLGRAGVRRLVLVGIGTVLEVAPGLKVFDTPGFPAEARAFSLGHVAQLEVLAAADPLLDWVVLAPPPVMLSDDDPGVRPYRTGTSGVLDPAGSGFAYTDLAAALLDEVDTPRRHRALVALDI